MIALTADAMSWPQAIFGVVVVLCIAAVLIVALLWGE